MKSIRSLLTVFIPLASFATGTAVSANDAGVVNVYSERHYDSDDQLYKAFEDKTGIKVNRLEGKADQLITRMKAEGENSPADVLLTVDASRAWRADRAGLYQSVDVSGIQARLPEALRHPDGHWFAVSQRARIIFYDKTSVDNPPQSMMDVVLPHYKGMVCMRSSSSTYSQTLLASIITRHGEEIARNWVRGLKANLAREPQGGDTDQLRGLVSGECKIAIGNSYYFIRALRKPVRDLSDEIDKIGWVFTDQESYGAHVNIATAGVSAYAPNKANAVKLVEFLLSDEGQRHFADANDEFPAVTSIEASDWVKKLGDFRADSLNLDKVAASIPLAQQIYDEEGYK